MLVVAKKPRIKIEIDGIGINAVIEALREKIPSIQIMEIDTDMDNEFENIDDSEWYKKINAEWHIGKTLKCRRINKGLTQKQLSEMTGIAVPNISKMEKGSRNIGANTARKLAAVLECDISDFI